MARPEIYAYLKENFTPVRIDFDRDKDAVREYGVRGIPDVWFLDSRGEKLKNVYCFVPEDTMLSILKYMSSDAFRKMSFQEFVRLK